MVRCGRDRLTICITLRLASGASAAGPCRCADRTAPATATPIAPPSHRKNATVVVAAPSSVRSTALWIAVVRFGIRSPKPIATGTSSTGR